MDGLGGGSGIENPALAGIGSVCAYALLVVVASWRLFVHRVWRWRDAGPKLWFHVFLFLFAASRFVSTTLFVLPFDTNVENMVLDSIATCFNLTLLLFLEIHWQIILHAGQSSSRTKVWIGYAVFNVLLYGVRLPRACPAVERATSILGSPTTGARLSLPRHPLLRPSHPHSLVTFLSHRRWRARWRRSTSLATRWTTTT